MEVKLSISSSRRISFASDFKDIDLEVEELENERDNPTYRGRVSYINSDSDDEESNYVNEKLWLKIDRPNKLIFNYKHKLQFIIHTIDGLSELNRFQFVHIQ